MAIASPTEPQRQFCEAGIAIDVALIDEVADLEQAAPSTRSRQDRPYGRNVGAPTQQMARIPECASERRNRRAAN